MLLAQQWLGETEQENKQPTATSLQKEFIAASQKAIEAEEKAEIILDKMFEFLVLNKITLNDIKCSKSKEFKRLKKIFNNTDI